MQTMQAMQAQGAPQTLRYRFWTGQWKTLFLKVVADTISYVVSESGATWPREVVDLHMLCAHILPWFMILGGRWQRDCYGGMTDREREGKTSNE